MNQPHNRKRNGMTISVTEELAREDVAYWRSKTPEERLDMVERLRLEAGMSLYEYPARLRRVITVFRN